MPKRTELQSLLILGSGLIAIGQAAEFLRSRRSSAQDSPHSRTSPMSRIVFWLAVLAAGFVFVHAAPAPAQSTSQLYTGHWTTRNAERYTVIAAQTNLAPHVYRITAPSHPVTTDTLRYIIYVDDVPLQAPLFQGGSAVVQGSKIAILQTGGSLTQARGSWTVVQEASVAAEEISWTGYPGIDRDVLVASLRAEQDFVLTLALGGNQCLSTMTVKIDGKPVAATTGQPMIFHRDSSILGRGKLVTVRVDGNCPLPMGITPVSGTLRIRQATP